MNERIRATAMLAIAALAMSCSDGELVGGGGDVSVASEAVVGPRCSSTVTHQCWGGISQGQAMAFDDFGGFKWFIRALTPTDVWPIGQFWTAGYADTFLRPAGGLPSPGKSVAAHTAFGIGTVFALSQDNVVRYSTGKPAASQLQPDGTNFAHWNVFIQPLDKDGVSLCLSKIVSLGLPTQFGQGRLLTALSCSGALYVQDQVGAERRWMPASQHPGFVGLPSLVWSDISHDRGGASLLSSSSRDVYRAAVGFITSGAGAVSWSPVTKLPQIFRNGTRLIPNKVGGRWVITTAGDGTCTVNVGCSGDDDRFYRFDATAGTWVRHTAGMGWRPTGQADIMPNLSPYDRAIVDNPTGFTELHAFSWMMPFVE